MKGVASLAKSRFIPQYRIIYDDLKAKIQDGTYAPGQQLPFERELCDRFGVQRITVRKALDLLVQDGMIQKHPGRGSFVRDRGEHSQECAPAGTLLFVMNKSQNDIHNNSSAYNAQLFFLMEQLCRKEGYTLLYVGISSAAEIHPLIEQHRVIGAFLVSTLDASILDCFLGLEIPLLCLNHYDPRILSVLPDNQSGILQAVSRLAALGRKRIAFVGGPDSSHNASERLESFFSAVNSLSLPLCHELILKADWTYDGSLACVCRMLAAVSRDHWPTGLIAASDMMAIGAIEAFSRAGLRIPRDLSVIGFDNIDLCKLSSPQLTSVGPDTCQMATIAVEHMISMLLRGCSSFNCYTVRVPIHYIERASVELQAGNNAI